MPEGRNASVTTPVKGKVTGPNFLKVNLIFKFFHCLVDGSNGMG
jgi:hypothetical protein